LQQQAACRITENSRYSGAKRDGDPTREQIRRQLRRFPDHELVSAGQRYNASAARRTRIRLSRRNYRSLAKSGSSAIAGSEKGSGFACVTFPGKTPLTAVAQMKAANPGWRWLI
jgi:hypothetical protein